MAEAAAAATVLQLIQFSGAVLTNCYAYISKAKSATNEIQKVINDVSGLEGILKHLNSLIQDDDSNRHKLLLSLAGPNGPLQACSQALDEMQKRLLALTQASSARRKLLWPLEEGKILDILRRLGEQKQTILLALAGDHAASDVSNAKQTKEVVDSFKNMQIKGDQAKVLRWLAGADPSTNYNTARKKHEKNTGSWLLQSPEFKSWKESDGSIMWLFGIPGAGKTILSSTVVDHLTIRDESLPAHPLAYFYFDFNDQGKQTAIGCLRSLTHQLCAHTAQIPDSIIALHAACHGRSASAAELTGALKVLLDETPKAYIVIDALDECKEEEGDRERTILFQTLSNLISSTKNLNLFFTSRPEPDIRDAMTELESIKMELKGDGVHDDISSYIISYLSNDLRMKKWPEDAKKAVISDLSSKANGM